MKATIGKIYVFAKSAESGRISEKDAIVMILKSIDAILKSRQTT